MRLSTSKQSFGVISLGAAKSLAVEMRVGRVCARPRAKLIVINTNHLYGSSITAHSTRKLNSNSVSRTATGLRVVRSTPHAQSIATSPL